MRLSRKTKQSEDERLECLQLDFSQTKESDEATWSGIKFGEIPMYLFIYLHTYSLIIYLLNYWRNHYRLQDATCCATVILKLTQSAHL